jgi:hypothetical protein
VRRIVTMLTSVLVMFLMSTGPASASTGSVKSDSDVVVLGGCLAKICGSVMNESNHVIWAIRDFDSNGPRPGTEWRALGPGQQTPSNEDWDGLYVECNASGRIATWTFPGIWVWSDFSLSAGWWMKVSTDQDGHVRNQSC